MARSRVVLLVNILFEYLNLLAECAELKQFLKLSTYIPMDRHHFVGIKLLVLSFAAHPFAQMPQLSFIFLLSSKTDNIPMKLFTCLIEINIAQLYLFPCSCLNV